VAPPAGSEPGENAVIMPYGEGVPPIIPHSIEEFLPIRIDANECLDCHVDAELVGLPVEEGDPTPAPASHFIDLRAAPETMTQQLIGARYFCDQCHVSQAATDPLVENSVH
jgi:nitrate reductase (cytochrome), electron transfer subunit